MGEPAQRPGPPRPSSHRHVRRQRVDLRNVGVRLREAVRHRARQRGSRGRAWRVGTPLAAVAAGTLMVTSAISSGGTDLRSERYADLADLARQESGRVQALREQVQVLRTDIESLAADVDDSDLRAVQRRLDALEEPAGLTPVAGPGLTIALDDAPERVQDAAQEGDATAIVHQQDIQAVVNALWAGGAEAMTIQGQRVITTTGIKCVGNTVILHGVPYAPPYVISAIGDEASMDRALDASAYVQAYLADVADYELGFEETSQDSLELPGYEGSLEMSHAQVVPAPDDDDET